MNSKLPFMALIVIGILLEGCSTWNKLDTTEKGAVIGGGSGALIGSAVAPGVGGTVVGGTLGAVGGGLTGNAIQQDERRQRRRHRDSDD